MWNHVLSLIAEAKVNVRGNMEASSHPPVFIAIKQWWVLFRLWALVNWLLSCGSNASGLWSLAPELRGRRERRKSWKRSGFHLPILREHEWMNSLSLVINLPCSKSMSSVKYPGLPLRVQVVQPTQQKWTIVALAFVSFFALQMVPSPQPSLTGAEKQ